MASASLGVDNAVAAMKRLEGGLRLGNVAGNKRDVLEISFELCHAAFWFGEPAAGSHVGRKGRGGSLK